MRFIIIIRVFIILIYFYNYYSNPDRLTGDYDEENGPKRREARRLGHSYVFFIIICDIYI